MFILGINDMIQDSSACIIKDGRIVAAVSEERLNRIKHAGGFPFLSIGEAIKISNIKAENIDCIAVGNSGYEFGLRMLTHPFKRNAVWSSAPNEPLNYFNIRNFIIYRKILENAASLRKADSFLSNKVAKMYLKKLGFKKPKTYFVNHHLSHASSAFYTSGHKKALILVLDAYGDGKSGGVYVGNDTSIEELNAFGPDNSLGELYGTITAIIGYRFGCDEGKTMALAPYGKPILYDYFDNLIKITGIDLKGDFTKKRRLSYLNLLKILKNYKKEDIAASIQKILEKKVTTLVENAVSQTGINKVVCSGGVFLNVKLNKKIHELDCVKDFFVFPSPSDEGTSIGSALYLNNNLNGSKTKKIEHTYFGQEFSSSDIMNELKKYKNKLKFQEITDISGYVAEELISKGKIVGWHQGKMEFGPRALGNRSIIADPRNNNSPEKIRKKIKKRPVFQPFCQSIAKGSEKDYVNNNKDIDASFMAVAFEATEKAIKKTPAVVHIDKSCRPQVLKKSVNERFYNLIDKFRKHAGVGAVLNTSFNSSGDAIVNAPEQAIKYLLNKKINYLAIGDYLLQRAKLIKH